MNLRDLEYLVAVDQVKHFRKAAEKCHVSQPTLSGQLKKLEEHLGVQLMERTSRSVVFTSAGKIIAAKAKAILGQCREMEALAQSFSDPMRASVRLGIIPTLAPYLIPLVMPPLKKAFPELDLQLYEVRTQVLTDMLLEDELDLGLLALPIEIEALEEVFLFDEPFLLAVSTEHELAAEEPFSYASLGEREVLLLEDGHCLRGQALDLCLRHGAREAERYKATSLETLRQMVVSGGGLTLIPKLAVPRGETVEKIIYRPFEEPAPCRSIGFLYRKTSSRLACFAKLGTLFRQVVEPHL